MMSKVPFFSIIIPCYNVAELIIPALNSINNQTFENFEVIFIDDGSTDNTFEVIKNFETSKNVLNIHLVGGTNAFHKKYYSEVNENHRSFHNNYFAK